MKGLSIVFVLGAGFSTPFGIPTMRPFLKYFRDMAKIKYPNLECTLERHFRSMTDDSDIEALLSSLGKAERLGEGIPPDTVMPEELRRWQEDSKFLKAHLIGFIIEQCERFDRELASETLVPTLRKLHESDNLGEVHIFTTNYDRVIEYACQVGEVPFSDGFGKADNELVSPWTRMFDEKLRIYKLHGSVSYYVDQRRSPPSFLRLDRGYALPGPNFRLSRDGHELEPLMVLPTLEKDVLVEPYSYLNYLFADTVRGASLVIAIGTSLRDNHIVSALSYGSDNLVALVVDTNPIAAAARIPGESVARLNSDAQMFFKSASFELIELIDLFGERGSVDFGELYAYSEREDRKRAETASLSSEQQAAYSCLVGQSGEADVLAALRELRGVSQDWVVQTIAKKGETSIGVDVRRAAAGCLGYSTNPVCIGGLRNIAITDESSAVRLECYLALEKIGSSVAIAALAEAKVRWPGDSYFVT